MNVSADMIVQSSRLAESEASKMKKVKTGLAYQNVPYFKNDAVRSIPCKLRLILVTYIVEPRKGVQEELVGPGSYDPNVDFTHKKLPQTSFPHATSVVTGPKRALESYITNIFSASTAEGNGGY